VHLGAFPGYFLSLLGPHFLREFYASFVTDPDGVGCAAIDTETGGVLGVVVGPLTPAGFFHRLFLRRWWAFAWASSGAILRRPVIIRRLVRAARYRGDAPSGGERALLSSIAVAPLARGVGVGQALIRAWVEEVRRRGGRGCYLTTDAEGNDEVNQFYVRNGWLLEASYSTPEGRHMRRYVLDLV
jgi:GNAT superfamily N-acetyltransferase